MTQEQTEIKQFITNKIQKLHPTCLIRDIRYESCERPMNYLEGYSFTFSYIKVNRDDTWMLCRVTVHMSPVRFKPSGWETTLSVAD